MKIIVVIPARGGTKGVPGKNIKNLAGKPLIEYTISAAREVFEDKEIIVSTDDLEIKKIVEDIGLKVPFMRPYELATDTASTSEVLLHAVDYVQSQGQTPDILVLLQPTSPFRKGNHIREALDIYKRNLMLDMVVSVRETDANPYFLLFEEDDRGFLTKSKEGNFQRRQDAPKVWQYNGAIYIINVDTLRKKPLNQFEKVVKYIMDEYSSIDIDTKLDWAIAQLMMENNSE